MLIIVTGYEPGHIHASNHQKHQIVVVVGAVSLYLTMATEKLYHSTKYGDTLKFTGDNYSQFRDSAIMTLASANAYRLVIGDEEEPRTREDAKDWQARKTAAVHILSGAISQLKAKKYISFVKQHDPIGLWAELAKSDRSTDPIWVSNIRRQFSDETFDPIKQTVQSFVDRLRYHQSQLEGSERQFSDSDLLEKLNESLPKNDPVWQIQKQWVLKNNLDLDSAILQYQQAEKPIQPAAAAASTTNTQGGGSRGRGSRGRGRSSSRRSRGRGSSRGRGGISKDRSENERSESSTRTRGSSSQSKQQDACHFCGKKGHWQPDCKLYIKARKVAQSGKSSQEASNKVDHESDDGSLSYIAVYNSPEIQYAMRTDNTMPRWLVDSGASVDFTGDITDCLSFTKWSTPREVRIADGTVTQSSGYGDVWVAGVLLRNVWVVPAFGTTRLLSVRSLARRGYKLVFEGDSAFCYEGKQLLWTAGSSTGLYIINIPSSTQQHALLSTSITLSTIQRAHSNGNTKEDQVEEEDEDLADETPADLWHRRLGHMNYKDLNILESKSRGIKLIKRQQRAGKHDCKPCSAGKMKESFVKKTDVRETVKGRKLHCDISGIREVSIRGYRYFLLLIDDATRTTWCVMLKTKSTAEILPELTKLLAQIENECGTKILIIRADNGKGEFGKAFQDHLAVRGTQFEPCPAYKHSMNGVSEISMWIVDCKARSMLYQAGVPSNLWCFAVQHSIWIKNRIPTSALPYGDNQAVTPFEAWHGRLPNLERLIVFGCSIWPIIPKSKFPSKSKPLIEEGHFICVGMKGSSIYRLLNMSTNRVDEHADVKCNEYLYPWRKYTQQLLERHPAVAPNLPILVQTPASQNTTIPTEDRTRSAESESRAVHPDPVEDAITRGIISRIPGQPTASGRVPYRRVFNDEIVQIVSALNAVQLESEKSTSLGAPSPPFEGVDTFDALEHDPKTWSQSVLEELRGLASRTSFSILKKHQIPSDLANRSVVTARFVLRQKFKANGLVGRRKARLVARGYEQQAGIDYFETFASVVRYTTLRIMLAKVAEDDLEADHVDIDTAFLNPELKEEIYMTLPDEHPILRQLLESVWPELKGAGNDVILKLNKALYGLKQAPRAWFLMVKRFFESLGLKASNCDPNLFTGQGVSILLFVDDMLITGKRAQVDRIKARILKQWKGKDLKAVKVFVGFQVERDRQNRRLKISQELYTTKLLERLKMDKSNPVKTPLPAGTVLKARSDDDIISAEESTVYRQIVGSVIYLSNNTRPDISYAVGQLARFMADPGGEHLHSAKHLLKYLNGTRSHGITYSNRAQSITGRYTVYADATWGTEQDRVSFHGYTVLRYGGAVSWMAQRQKSTAQSSMEAEIMAANEAAKEVAWLEKVSLDLHEEPQKPTLYCDNLGGTDLMRDTKYHTKAKHIEIRYFFIRNDMVQKDRLAVEHIPGTEQPADILTKQLPFDPFRKHCITLGLD
jgi:hypothetical protein